MTERKIRSAEEMKELAGEVANGLKAGDLVLLYGDLGVGKTTFVKGLAEALGVKEMVTSPTFNVVAEYPTSPLKGLRGAGLITKLVHVDLYRLDQDKAANDPAIRDILERVQEGGRLTVIEWADRLRELDVRGARKLYMEHGEAVGERIVKIDS